jgi:hypothetical protein
MSAATYSALLVPLGPAAITGFVHSQLDRVGLAHATFSDAAIHLIARSSEGVLRCVKNLCVGGMIQAVRDQARVIETKHINAVLMQPHWRQNRENEGHETVRFTNHCSWAERLPHRIP